MSYPFSDASILETSLASPTSQAEALIRAIFLQRLRSLPGPEVSLLNIRDNSTPPLNFEFITESVLGMGVSKADPGSVEGCQLCRPHMGSNIGCEYTKVCSCLEFAAVNTRGLSEEERQAYEEDPTNTTGMAKKFPYYSSGDRKGCLVNFYLSSRNAIYECNTNCNCGPGCKNRNAQHGRKVALEIFKTKNRGWSLRCKQDLLKGQFIDTYLGEIITSKEADERERKSGVDKPSYLYTLDKFANDNNIPEDECYVVDGQYKGGPTRFVNHSCAPNCRQYTVSYNKYDARVYDIAFFASENIPAGTELTFDYLDKEEGEEPQVEDGHTFIECRCGAEECRGRLWM